MAALSSLTVKGRGPKTGYDREQFGQAWLDADRNGCDTRNDALDRWLRNKRKKPGSCRVLSGDLVEPYTGHTVHFVRDGSYTQALDIDHIVALANIWVSGGARMDIRTRAMAANDPLNLRPVDPSANRQKGEGDAATWLPPNKKFRCTYVATQVAVKTKYRLTVTPAEKQAIHRILTGCPAYKLPSTAGPTTVPFPVTKPEHHTPGPVRSAQPPAQRSHPAEKRAPAGSGTVPETIHAGAFCKKADAGKNGTTKTGLMKTCKADKSGRLRWR